MRCGSGWLHLINPRTTHRLNQIEPPTSSTNSIQDQSSRFASIELDVGTPLDPLIFFLLRGSWSFVELTRKPLS
ncbi:hypothetical protein PGTUg99_000273 [Puccinia graminis f. sp. tritici]|uniref:Uncharacterized protein n=1 Tax=Puccinia graminis f. sp. tritici TaxID=56615 RepID=A0A5B0PPV0_PUCGR|nr:hypothetical protein PGTUg99_000273 [Puccinia graminis f. sp. tritici]